MTDWLRAHPFVVLLLPLIAGILLCEYTGFPFDLPYAQPASFPDSIDTFAAVIEDGPVEKKRTCRYTAVTAYGRVYLYLQKDSALIYPTIGDYVQFRGVITRPDSIGGFDYGKYLRRQGIVGQSFVRGRNWTVTGRVQRLTLRMKARQVQYHLGQRYRALGIAEAESGVLSAITLGYREDLDPDIKRSFQRAGAAHILAVSGLHTGIIYAVILLLITGFGRWKPLYANRWHRVINSIVIIVLMWGYALLTGLSPSVVRSVLMLTIAQAAYACYRNPLSLNTVAAAAFLILAFRPNDLFSVSFQLSFAAVTAILILEPPLRKLLPIPKGVHPVLRDTLSYIRGLLTVSVAAQVGTLPLMLYYFGQTCNAFILTNIVVIPLAFCITVLAFATLTIGWIPYVGIVLAIPLEWLTWALNHYTGWIEHLPHAVAVFPISASMAILLYAALVTAVLVFRRSLWWLIAVAVCLASFCALAVNC